ncbi:MAG: glycosyltransferase family 4 protein [Pseudoalteromonas prydzensis]|uniref:glycosyltransferase family 4 protein n=1 Tax=Pseudoalteromonas prydzensis TaxID=182141 RepID=UPI003F9923C3
MKIIAFVGETFQKFNGVCYTKPTSAAFLQDTIGKENVYVCSPCKDVEEKPTDFSTEVDESQFYSFPAYSSTKDFAIKAVFKRGYLKQYQEAADLIIKKHPGEYFWIRTPSIGSVVFGLQALNAGEKVIHHMCADASNTWRDTKYSLPEKVVGYLLSRFIRRKLSQICQYKNTINVCTGDVLEKFSLKYSPNKTYQFVDVMVKQPNISMTTYKKDKQLSLLFVGRIVEDKGIFDLIKVASEFSGNVKVKIVGGGPDLDQAKALVNTFNMQEHIVFTGQLQHKELSQLYCESDAVVVPSNNFYEGFPRVIMEGWSHHKPVIVSQVGGVKAFVNHKENGLIFTPGSQVELRSHISALLSDEMLYEKIKSGAVVMSEKSTQVYWINVLSALLKSNQKDET